MGGLDPCPPSGSTNEARLNYDERLSCIDEKMPNTFMFEIHLTKFVIGHFLNSLFLIKR